MLTTWIRNVATDAQLDVPVPKCGGLTGRQLLSCDHKWKYLGASYIDGKLCLKCHKFEVCTSE